MVGVEPLGPGEGPRPRQLDEQLTLASAVHVELAQERRDRRVVVAQQPKTLERVVAISGHG